MSGVEPQAIELSPKEFDFSSKKELGAGGVAREYVVKFRDVEVAVKVPHWNDSSGEQEVSCHKAQERLLLSRR